MRIGSAMGFTLLALALVACGSFPSGGRGTGGGGTGGAGGGGGSDGTGGDRDAWKADACVDLNMALTRIRFEAEEPTLPRCFRLGLVQSAGLTRFPSLELPDGWDVERAVLFPSPCASADEESSQTALDASGSIGFSAINPSTEAPSRLAIDADFTFPADASELEQTSIAIHDVPVPSCGP